MAELQGKDETVELLKSIDKRLRTQDRWLICVFVLVFLQIAWPILAAILVILSVAIPSLL